MTRYELISAIAKKAGVSNIEATALFEIFLRKISEKISVNQVGSIEGLGFFNSRKGISKKNPVTAGSGDLESLELDLMIFSENLEEIDDNKKSHTFIMPKSTTENVNEIDSHFSPSVKKPSPTDKTLPPAAGGRDSFQNLYGKELKKYLNNKAEQLLSNIKISEHKTDDHKLITDEIPKPDETGFSIISHDQVQNIAKELGKEVGENNSEEDSKIKVKKTLQMGKDKQRLESLPWNFGSKFPVKKIEEHEEEKNDQHHTDKVPRDILYERKPEPFRVGKPKGGESKEKQKEDEVSKEELESEISEIIGNYQRVKPILTDETEAETLKTIETKKHKPEEKIRLSPTALKREPIGYNEVKSKSESLQLKDELNNKKREWKRENQRKERERSDEDEFYTKKPGKSKLPAVMGILFAIIVVSAGVYLFIEPEILFGEKTDKPVVNIIRPPEINIETQNPNVSAEFPSEDENVQDEPILSEQKEEKGIEINTEPIKTAPVTVKKTEEKPVTKKEVVAPPPPVVKEESIIKSGDYFNILMGVYNSEETAESEAEKYNDMGYNAFVQSTMIPGQGVRYRVRVGDFTSEENARKFKNLHGK